GFEAAPLRTGFLPRSRAHAKQIFVNPHGRTNRIYEKDIRCWISLVQRLLDEGYEVVLHEGILVTDKEYTKRILKGLKNPKPGSLKLFSGIREQLVQVILGSEKTITVD